MAAQLRVGTDIVGKIKKNYGKKGVIRQVSGTPHNKKYVVQWEDGGSTTESTRAICLPHVFGQLKTSAPGKGKKRLREVLQVDENSPLPADDDSEDGSEDSYMDEESGEPQRYALARATYYTLYACKYAMYMFRTDA